jgi:hypothetical protein
LIGGPVPVSGPEWCLETSATFLAGSTGSAVVTNIGWIYEGNPGLINTPKWYYDVGTGSIGFSVVQEPPPSPYDQLVNNYSMSVTQYRVYASNPS